MSYLKQPARFATTKEITLVKSDEIKVFPCGRRSADFDPEARMSTELNNTIRSSIGGAYTNSFLDHWNDSGLKCVVNGYTFEIPSLKFTQGDLNSLLPNGMTPQAGNALWAVICLTKATITSGEGSTPTKTTQILDFVVELDTQNTLLDINTYFYGFGFYYGPTEPKFVADSYQTKALKIAEVTPVNEWSQIIGGVMVAELAENTAQGTYTLKLQTNQRRPIVFEESIDANTKLSFVLSDSTAYATAIIIGRTGTLSDGKLAIPEIVSKNGQSFWVTQIRAKAFQNDLDIKELSIPSSMKIIGARAFEGCLALTKLTIFSETEIEDLAFLNCRHLLQVIVQPQLETPVVRVADNGLAQWEAIENAEVYIYKIGNNTIEETTTTSVMLSASQSIIVKAKGITKGTTTYKESFWSTPIAYTPTDT